MAKKKNQTETEYLLSSPENAKRLMGGIENLKNGKTVTYTVEDLETLNSYLKILQELSELNRNISYAEIPAPFLEDFRTFNFGATIYKNDKGEFCVPPGDYLSWYNKIIHLNKKPDVSSASGKK